MTTLVKNDGMSMYFVEFDATAYQATVILDAVCQIPDTKLTYGKNVALQMSTLKKLQTEVKKRIAELQRFESE